MNDALPLLLDHYRTLTIQIEQLTTQQKAIKQAIRDQVPQGQSVEHDGVKAAWAKARINQQQIAQEFPVEEFPHLYKQTLDMAAVKKHVPPAVMDQYRDTPQLRVTL